MVFQGVIFAEAYDIDIRGLVYSEYTKIIVKATIRTNFIQNWYTDVNDMSHNPILRTYVLFKKDFVMSSHLFHVKNAMQRNAINKLRCSSYLLSIERGRHTRPKMPIEERLCFYCKSIEDEIHFISDCRLYDNIRSVFISKVTSIYPCFESLSSREKCICLFKSDVPMVLAWLG